jgi:iron(III) transport system substrate-binding protein
MTFFLRMRAIRTMLLLHIMFIAVGCNSYHQQEVIVYVAVDRRDAEPILKKFELSTGIRVRALYDSESAKTTGLVTRLIAEQEHPRCDVFWNNEHIQTMLLVKQGLCDVIPKGNSDNSTGNEKRRLAAVASRSRVIVYNKNILNQNEVPKTLRELASPQFRGRCAIADPQFGTTRTHIAFLSARNGQDWVKTFLTSLLDNDVHIVSGNAAVKDLVASAQQDDSSVCVGLTDTDDVVTGINAGQPIQMIIPDKEDGGTFVIPSTVCILKKCPNPKNARTLVAFLLSNEITDYLTTNNLGYQSIEEIECTNNQSPSVEEILNHLLPSSRWTRDNFHSR